MTRIKDIVVDGSREELSKSLETAINSLEQKATEIWGRQELGDACRVFPGLLRCTARQLRILEGSGALPVEVTAGACRTTFETNIRTRLVLTKPDYLMRFQREFIHDEQSLLSGFLELSKDDEASAVREVIQAREVLKARLDQIDAFLHRHRITPENPRRWNENANDAGLLDEYKTLWRFYSHYVHGSAWLILSTEEQRENDYERTMLVIMTQIYAGDTFSRIVDTVDSWTTSISR